MVTQEAKITQEFVPKPELRARLPIQGFQFNQGSLRQSVRVWVRHFLDGGCN